MGIERDRRKRRRHGGGSIYDGVPDEDIYARDRWECQMPVCLRLDGRAIDRALKGKGRNPWGPSIDHIVPLADGGPDTEPNKRAAHRQCNTSAGRSRMMEREKETVGQRVQEIISAVRAGKVKPAPPPRP